MKEVITDIKRYMVGHAEIITTVKNVKTEMTSKGVTTAQQIEFKRFINPEDKTEHYFITTVHRTKYRTYLGTKQCIERNYEVTREEGNQIYADIKCGKTILIPEE